jgi:hypothetical protein
MAALQRSLDGVILKVLLASRSARRMRMLNQAAAW